MTSIPVHLDTCVILAACRAGCWRALMGGYELHTTSECRLELTQGNRHDPKYVALDMNEFDRRVQIHEATSAQIATAGLKAPVVLGIDAGERTLLAWCLAQPGALLLSTGDRAAVNGSCQLGLQDRLISLEELTARIGVRVSLPKQYTRAWLTKIRSDYLLGITAL